jgi:hypothetical protein
MVSGKLGFRSTKSDFEAHALNHGSQQFSRRSCLEKNNNLTDNKRVE